MPTILLSPKDLLLKQWHSTYNLGIRLGPPAAILACSTLGYASYAKHNVNPDSPDWQGLAIAALGNISIVPFTWTFLLPTNAMLLAESEKKTEDRKMTEVQVKAAVRNWGHINGYRCVLPLATVMLWALDCVEIKSRQDRCSPQDKGYKNGRAISKHW